MHKVIIFVNFFCLWVVKNNFKQQLKHIGTNDTKIL